VGDVLQAAGGDVLEVAGGDVLEVAGGDVLEVAGGEVDVLEVAGGEVDVLEVAGDVVSELAGVELSDASELSEEDADDVSELSEGDADDVSEVAEGNVDDAPEAGGVETAEVAGREDGEGSACGAGTGARAVAVDGWAAGDGVGEPPKPWSGLGGAEVMKKLGLMPLAEDATFEFGKKMKT
jgi:hypothetical protein